MGDDKRSTLAYSVFLAWFGSGYIFVCQSRWSPDHISTCLLYQAVTCLRRLRSTRNSGFTGETTSGICWRIQSSWLGFGSGYMFIRQWSLDCISRGPGSLLFGVCAT